MQTYDERLRASHTLSRIRSFPAPETVSARREGATARPAHAPVLPGRFVPTSAPAIDTVERVGAIVPMDGQNRIAAGKLAKAMGWAPGATLVGHCAGDRVTLSAGPVTSPAQFAATLDDDCRLTLSSSAVAVLGGARKGDQLLGVAIAATGELVLMGAAAALASLTGPVSVPAAEAAPQRVPTSAAATRIRARWQAPDVA